MAALADREKGKLSGKRIPLVTVEEVLRLCKEKYYDLNIRHFHEKLREGHQIQLSYTWVQKALQGAGLVARRHKRGPRIGGGVRDGRCRGCCYTSTVVSTVGSTMIVGTT
jgi:hypothetical protein